jgi:hypothetical protein
MQEREVSQSPEQTNVHFMLVCSSVGKLVIFNNAEIRNNCIFLGHFNFQTMLMYSMIIVRQIKNCASRQEYIYSGAIISSNVQSHFYG